MKNSKTNFSPQRKKEEIQHQYKSSEFSYLVWIVHKIMSPSHLFQIKMESQQSPLSMSTFSMSSSPPTFLDTTPSPLSSTKKQQQQNQLNDSPETRAMKRERNRLAARRCRQKQKDRIDYLEKVK